MREKLKVGPFGWFKCAPNGTDVTSTSTTLASTEPLNDRVLNEIRKCETELLSSHIVTDGFDPLHWWRQHEQSDPSLSDCARRLLVIPASSAECERHFGALNARHIITSERNMLFPETVEALSIVSEGWIQEQTAALNCWNDTFFSVFRVAWTCLTLCIK